MLIEFKTTNFRSIREEQILNLVASNSDKALTTCLIKRALPGLSGVQFLKGAAIYGANASGKSNVLESIKFVSDFILHSATKLTPGDSTGVEPFKLDQESTSKPSEFEITFVADGVRFVFGFSATQEKVMEEYLIAYPKGSPQRWYHRTFNSERNVYDWTKPNTAFKKDKELQKRTRDNSLYLSVGPQFNHPQLTQVFNWFKNNLKFLPLNADNNLHPQFTAKQLGTSDKNSRILNLLRSADIGISDAMIQEKEISIQEIKENLPPSLLARIEQNNELKPGKHLEINLLHKVEGSKSIALDFNSEESAGTRRFFSIIGPWIDILEKGYTVFIDEIETSLHPLLVRELLNLLFCEKNNPNGAQVVFTTHNPMLLDGSLMRRDQVWFTEKSPTGATHLYPLTDYQPRKNEALVRGYLAGRYGAIPFIPEGLIQ